MHAMACMSASVPASGLSQFADMGDVRELREAYKKTSDMQVTGRWG